MGPSPESHTRAAPKSVALAGSAAGRLAAAALGVLLGATTVCVHAQAPFDFDTAPGRLPKSVVPQSYDIDITPDTRHLRIAGHETVALQFHTPAATIVFNSLHESLRDVRLDGQPVRSVSSDDARQLTTVTLAAPAAAGAHRLSFDYTGRIETQPVGLFAQHYRTPDGRQRLLLSTQMEATDARRMFPCWDEPAFRAVFRLTVTVPQRWATVSNMPLTHRVVHGSVATVSFQPTPAMPSYLVEFSAGDLQRIDARRDGVDFGVWATEGLQQQGESALANAQQILSDYDDYFAYPYPLPKLDSIAVPGGFSGAMENWGAITYQQSLLLLPAAASIGERQEVYSIQAHEMAHQWTGDLVTMGWWDDLWLNESFASWMSARETALRHPGWNWWERQDGDKEGAMSADAHASSQPIEQHVTDELQASNAFDPAITYSKGQAVLRMLETWLGPDVFRDGLRRYIKARAYSNATAGDLWQALGAASGRDLATIAAPWIQQPGFPLISVQAQCAADGARTLQLSQQRFLLRGQDPAARRWQVPLQIRSGATAAPVAALLTHDGQTFPAGRCGEPLSLNAGDTGFYRVRYAPATLATDTRDFALLPDADRIALLDDQWALVEADIEPLPDYLALAAAMGGNRDSRAWEQISAALGAIEYDERGTAGHAAFASYARALIRPVADQLGWNERPEETPDVQRLRRTLLSDLGSWGDRAVLDVARRRFDAYLADNRAVPPDQRELVLSLVALDADQRIFDQLHRLALQATNEHDRQRAYSALMQVSDPALAAQAAQIALAPEIPPQDAELRLGLIATLADRHPQLAWRTFSRHADQLLRAFATFEPLYLAQYVPEIFWNGLPPDQLEAWVRARVPSEMSAQVQRGMDVARFQLSEQAALVPAADAYLRALAPAAATPPDR